MEKLTKEEFIEKFNKVQDTFQAAEQCIASDDLEECVDGTIKFEEVIDDGIDIMFYTLIDDGATARMMYMLNKAILKATLSDIIISCFDSAEWANKLNDIIDFYQKAKLNNKIGKVTNYNYMLATAYNLLGASYKIMGNANEAICAFQKAAEFGSQGAKVYLGVELDAMKDYVGAFKALDSVDILSPVVAVEMLEGSTMQAFAMYCLAGMYLFGRGVKQDFEKAYNILQMSSNHKYDRILTSGSQEILEKILKMTREELSHFKRGLFGGLRYVP